MKYAGEAIPEAEITAVTATLEDRACTLRWRWPDQVQAVCIHKGPAGQTKEGAPPSGLKLYTREEYKANNGYRDRLDDIGLVEYTVYARLSEGGETVLLRQPGGGNRTVVSAGKARIYYSIQNKKSLFGKHKTVNMTISSEVPVPKDVLCYVKKTGGSPVSKDDGIRFPFIDDFPAGRSVLPPIEIGRDDQIRIFFTDGRTYGRYYELIPE
ncbi:beta-mannanase [Paenibacillus sp. NFR01]|uniref:beta-mannanase n=1 Tax=Paenibacillus sp. NFR01 TaxID=1566279 RepID=UPI0008B43082|nr:beta-mannanase [Paenibacillus sp. NFR01]SEU01643.1 hypothetical protein SAMN03159358_3106 [Paenibacillus sp. NFR01]